jgi:hypothetical protein
MSPPPSLPETGAEFARRTQELRREMLKLPLVTTTLNSLGLEDRTQKSSSTGSRAMPFCWTRKRDYLGHDAAGQQERH